jgi:hypothetical protein
MAVSFHTGSVSAGEIATSAFVQPFVAKHCASCHSGGKKSGKFDFDALDFKEVAGKHAQAWRQVAERISRGEMPPEDRPRPDSTQASAVVQWIVGERKKAGLEVAGLGSGPTGNHLDHALLFSGKTDVPLDNPPRLWRFSPEIYAIWVLRNGTIKGAKGQAMTPLGGHGFKDQAEGLTIDEGTLAVVLRNAQQTAVLQTAHRIEDGKIVVLPGTPQGVRNLLESKNEPTREKIAQVINGFAYYRRWSRFTPEEMDRLLRLYERASKDGGRVSGLRAVFTVIQLMPESLFRMELGLGPANEKGQRLLGPRELAYAISFALEDAVDRKLVELAEKGTLQSRADVAREVSRLLDDPKLTRPRILRFFQEYFGYTTAPEVFKDNAAGNNHHGATLVADTDRLVDYLLKQDKNVLKELLTTRKSFVATMGSLRTATISRALPNIDIHRNYGLDAWPEKQPVDLPGDQRAGILTQPSWLVAHGGNFDNQPVQRGKWIRERLLGGVIPPVPITVNAQVPDDPARTLRDRLTTVTKVEFCWQCHQKMNPLGLPFEQYDHFGRFRTVDEIVDATRPPLPPAKKGGKPRPVLLHPPIDTTGALDRTGDKALEGPIDNPVTMMKRLADSARVRQVFIRHAFRYWMGRDENLGDAPTLIEADRAYVESGGSMKALLQSLLTSDSFLLRTPPDT